jgi:hypothetical protein
MSGAEDYYKTLGIDKNASQEQIKKAYRYFLFFRVFPVLCFLARFSRCCYQYPLVWKGYLFRPVLFAEQRNPKTNPVRLTVPRPLAGLVGAVGMVSMES